MPIFKGIALPFWHRSPEFEQLPTSQVILRLATTANAGKAQKQISLEEARSGKH